MKTAVVRHPMPYGDLARQIAQRFASPADLDYANCTLEEGREPGAKCLFVTYRMSHSRETGATSLYQALSRVRVAL
jgi:predicted GTPase